MWISGASEHLLCWTCGVQPVAAFLSAAEVQGHIDLDVYSEVLGPFKIIPRGVLEAGGNTVMGALVNNLLPVFLRRCAVRADSTAHRLFVLPIVR